MRVRNLFLHPGCAILLVLVLALPLHGQLGLESITIPHNTGASAHLNQGIQTSDLRFDPEFQSNGPAAANAADENIVPVGASASPFNFESPCSQAEPCLSAANVQEQTPASTTQRVLPDAKTDPPDASVKASSAVAQHYQRPDRNLDIYYRNRREFSLDVGWHPVNIPFIYDFAVGDGYNMTPLKYTLVPIVASLRWHVTNVGWKSVFRGNMDFTFSGSITAIPRGPETHYYSFDFGIRRNFVYRNWKVVPFFEQRGGAGLINAKEPLGVLWAQGQNLTFTYNMGAGVRYNIDSKYSFSAGMNYMHISNGYLSQPQFYNYGINVYGPMFGMDVRLSKPHHASP